MANYDLLKNKPRTGDRSELPDVYQQARDLEVRTLANKVVTQAGRAASPQFLHEVARAIVEEANKRGSR